jgi:tetratricopeptide (TPR) repeat protein
MFYQDQGKFSQAEEAYKKAIEVKKLQRDWAALSVLYHEIGKPELAKECAKKAEALRSKHYNLIIVNNYLKLKSILDKRGIKLACVQYPMRSIEPLKKIFQGNEQGIVFVDNEMIFKDVVEKTSYSDYFSDAFGGDFGHCTNKGNKLLAENIANAILKEAFNK